MYAVTETCLSDFILDKEIIPCDYLIFHTDRPTRGRGVLLAIHSSIPTKLLSSPPNLKIVSVKWNCKTSIIICPVYIPPETKLEYYTCISNYLYLGNLLSQNHNIILLGDFNLPDIDWNSLSGHFLYSSQLCKQVFQYNLMQLVTFPMHVMGNILDLILSDNIDLISNTTAVSSQSSLLTSDHYAISFCVSTSPTKQLSHTGFKRTMDYSHADILTSYLLEYNFTSLYIISYKRLVSSC